MKPKIISLFISRKERNYAWGMFFLLWKCLFCAKYWILWKSCLCPFLLIHPLVQVAVCRCLSSLEDADSVDGMSARPQLGKRLLSISPHLGCAQAQAVPSKRAQLSASRYISQRARAPAQSVLTSHARAWSQRVGRVELAFKKLSVFPIWPPCRWNAEVSGLPFGGAWRSALHPDGDDDDATRGHHRGHLRKTAFTAWPGQVRTKWVFINSSF